MCIFKPKSVFVVSIHSLSGVMVDRVYSSESEALQFCNTFNRVSTERSGKIQKFCVIQEMELK